MRVLYHISGGVIGGAETQTVYLINSLPPDIASLITYDNPHIEGFLFNALRGRCFFKVLGANSFIKKIHEWKPDIVQFYHDPKFYDLLNRSGYDCPRVEVAHNRSSFGWDSTTYPRHKKSTLVAVSPCAKEHYVSKRGYDAPIVLIPNGVDSGVFFPRSDDKPRGSRLVGGFCGRLEGGEGKGVPEIIKIASELPIDIELVGYDFGNYAKKTENMRNVKVFKHTKNIADFYRKWDFFVSCSPKEGFGLAIAEALACGLPCIILDCGGICRYLTHKKHAYIAKDLSDVKRGIALLIKGELDLKPLEVDFSAKTMADKYVDLYNSIKEPDSGAFIAKPVEVKPYGVRISNKVLGIVPTGWQGIRKAIGSRCDEMCDPSEALRMAKLIRPAELVFGGFNKEWLKLARDLKILTKAPIIITYHGTAVLNEFHDANRQGLLAAITAAKEGLAVLSLPHEGMVRALNTLHKVNAIYEPNKLEAVESGSEKLSGLNIGLFGTGMPWKNLDTQVLAAAATPNLKVLHIQGGNNDLLNCLGIPFITHPYYQDRQKFYDLAASMTLNLAVSLTETFGYFCLESFMLGVPAIVSAVTPSMRDAKGDLRKCIVNYYDDPAAIADAIQEVLDDYDNICRLGREYSLSITK